MFKNPETGKWGVNHLLKDFRKAHKIYEALPKKLQPPTPAAQPAGQLALQTSPAAAPPPAHIEVEYVQPQPR